MDTTVVSSLHCDGSPHRGAADADGAVLVAARRRKERTYPELVRPGRRARLVVLAGDVAGRWSFIRHMAKAGARGEPTILKKRAEQAWRMRWCCLLACAAARAFAASLLERRGPGGVDGETPSVHHVVNDWRFASLGLACVKDGKFVAQVGRSFDPTCSGKFYSVLSLDLQCVSKKQLSPDLVVPCHQHAPLRCHSEVSTSPQTCPE